MNTDLRDKIAAALYLFTEQADQGTPGWDELIANHGEEYETIVAYRAMADFVMPMVDAEIAGWDKRLQRVVRSRNSFISRLDERNRDIEGNIRALNEAITGRAYAERERDEASAEVERLQKASIAYRSSVRAAHHSCDDCPDRSADKKHQGSRVLVEGSWFDRDDLPRILGDHMRSLAEAERSLKEMAPGGSVDPGCTCSGMAACEQCHERDALTKHVRVALQMGWDVGRAFGDPYQRRGPHDPADNPFRARGDA